MLSLCPFDISVGIRAFVIGLSQISSFFFSLLIDDLHVYDLLLNIVHLKTQVYIPINHTSKYLKMGFYIL